MILLDEPIQASTPKWDIWDRLIRNPEELKKRHGCCIKRDKPEDPSKTDALINKQLHSNSEAVFKNLLAKAMLVSTDPEPWRPMWSVRPRNNPCIGSPIFTLDLPEVRSPFCGNLMDWSKKDFLTVAFPNAVYLWDRKKHLTTQCDVSNTTCIKWNKEGTLLFTAFSNGLFEVYNIDNLRQPLTKGERNCHPTCYVTDCSFHPSTDMFMIGCSRGATTLYCLRNRVQYISHRQHSKDSISSVSFSCDGKHYSASSISGSVNIRPLNQMSRCPLFYVDMGAPVRALAWHPWESSTLVVSNMMANMSLFNIRIPHKATAIYSSVYKSSIVALTFNPITAELVVSHRLYGSRNDVTYLGTQLNVLASFDRVVDRMESHTGRVVYMKWSPDGTDLATCANDETARIWKFLPASKRQSTQKRSESNYTPSPLKIGNQGMALR